MTMASEGTGLRSDTTTARSRFRSYEDGRRSHLPPAKRQGSNTLGESMVSPSQPVQRRLELPQQRLLKRDGGGRTLALDP
jgi:hypothetical protein